MNISLDYDQTYTRDPVAWDAFITLMKAHGHKVFVVTMRYDNPKEADEVKAALSSKVEGIYFTGRLGKRSFMFKRDISIDVWVDDTPYFIEHDAREIP